MKLSIKSFAVIIAFLFLFIGYQSQQIAEGHQTIKHACSACSIGETNNEPHKYACAKCEDGLYGETVWCEPCKAGYIKMQKIKCRHCFEGMSDKKDVWCESCNTGYSKGKKVDCKKCYQTGKICESCQKA